MEWQVRGKMNLMKDYTQRGAILTRCQYGSEQGRGIFQLSARNAVQLF